jgi:hypothetical protein
VPALYALWFRVRKDEEVTAGEHEALRPFDPRAEALPVAAE